MFEDWNTKLLKKTPTEFEELCFTLIQEMGFKNTTWREPGADGGRDIEAQRTVPLPDGYTEIIEKWFFECKRHDSSISQKKISANIDSAQAENADILAIMSNNHLSNPCREFIRKREDQTKVKIIDWTGIKFLNILFSNQSVFGTFFPNENIPKHFLSKVDKKEIVPLVKDRFISMGLTSNMNLEKSTKEVKITSEDPDFIPFIENKVLTLPNLTTKDKKFIFDMLVVLLVQKGEFEKANEYNQKILSEDPENEIALLNEGVIYSNMKKFDEALTCYEHILLDNPKNPIALNNKGHILQERNQDKHALRYFEKALENSPHYELAMSNKARLLHKMGKKTQALFYLKNMISERPNSFMLWYTKSVIFRIEFDYKAAYDAINRSLELNPNYRDAINEKGVILEHNANFQFRKKYNEMAMEIFQRLTELYPKYEIGWTNKLVCLENLGEDEAVEELFRTLEENFPDESISKARRAGILKKKGKLNEALQLAKDAKNINKKNFHAIKLECEIYLEFKRYKKVWRIARKTLNICNDKDYKFQFFDLLGYAYEGLGKQKKAEKAFQKGQENQPNPISLIEDQIEKSAIHL